MGMKEREGRGGERRGGKEEALERGEERSRRKGEEEVEVIEHDLTAP